MVDRSGAPLAHADTHTVVANDYTLTLDEGLWIATFPPKVMQVKLGMNGETVVLLADGSYSQVSDGATRWRTNGRNPCARVAGGSSWYCVTRSGSEPL